MQPVNPLDAAMITADVISNPLHVAAVLILSPPDDAGSDYVDELHQRPTSGNTASGRRCVSPAMTVFRPALSGESTVP